MDEKNRKPKKTARELVEKLKDKGVTFNRITEDEAVEYLSKRNNYLRTASYRKCYEKHKVGENEGKYIHLDFYNLTELSSIDMHLRNQLLKMCIDIEHALKVALLTEIENNPREDGYILVEDFFFKYPEILSSVKNKADAIFTEGLISNYFDLCYVLNETNDNAKLEIQSHHCPIWVLMELISFGDTLKLYDFYNEKYPVNKLIKIDRKVLNPVKSLRNACAHNNCLLNAIGKKETNPSSVITQYISQFHNIGKEERKRKLSYRPFFEIVCMLFVYEKVVSKNVKNHKINDLKFFIHTKMFENINYFVENQTIYSSFIFLKKVVDNVCTK